MSALPAIATIPQLLALSAERHAGHVAIDDAGVRLTYAELHAQVLRAARALIALGIRTGDRVAVWGPNIHEWIVAALAIQTAGGVLVPVSTRMKGLEAADVLQQSEARVLFCIGDFLGQFFPRLLDGHDLPALQYRIVLRGGAQDRPRTLDWDAFLAHSERTDDATLARRMAEVKPDSLSDVLYTSGTTGRPKGVMTTHAQNLRAFECWTGVLGMTSADRYLIVNPFFHSAGYKAGWLAALIRGATILPHPVFDAEQILLRIAQERISFLLGPPTLFLTLLAHPRVKEFDLSCLRVAVTGAASVPPVLVRRMRDELGFRIVVTAYGLTECCGFATICNPQDDAETIANTCGQAIPDVEVRCADPQGNTVPAGEPGEVLIRGYNVMQGYLNNEAATREAIDAEGWLHTGDVGVMDDKGYLRITDRMKDMFIVGGFNCYPAEIERLANAHPAIANIAVIGAADERQGEVGRAFIVLRPGTTLSAEEFVAWCRAHMTNYKVPRYVDILPALPLNGAGKVDKLALRAMPQVSPIGR
ncbi:MAG TPA: FadD3 family acyl-CoA ligase [Burkholderiaceae bacterium]|nr:FadD3 family acyl-CoA ligase [Burkholderiaceae bacterium]